MIKQINLFLNGNIKKMLKIGIVGTGYFGEIHIKVLLTLKNKFKIVGFFDINKQKTKKICKKYKIPLLKLEDLIKKSQVVNITSKTNTHFELIKLALKEKKHVFVEKPICESLDEIKIIEKINQSLKVHIQVGFIERFNPAFLSLSSIKFKAKHIKVIRSTSLLTRNKNNSITQDLMIHDIDIINTIINSYPKNINVCKKRKNYISCNIIFNNGCVAELNSERTNAKNKKIERKMIIKTEDKREILIDFSNQKTSIKTGNNILLLKEKKANQLEEELKYLYECIINKKENNISLEAAKKCSIITEEIESQI